MKKTLLILLLFTAAFSFSQTKDYYIKKGAVVEGYDVVSYFNKHPTKGKKEFTTTYDDAKFLFSTAKNLEKFKANPKQYLPQYGGWCAYALGKNNEKYSINPESYEIKNGKLYLFYNSWGINTLAKWNKEQPENLRKQADLNWNNYNKKQLLTKKP